MNTDFFKDYKKVHDDIIDKEHFLIVSNYLDDVIFKRKEFIFDEFIELSKILENKNDMFNPYSIKKIESIIDVNFVKLLHALQSSDASLEECLSIFKIIFEKIDDNFLVPSRNIRAKIDINVYNFIFKKRDIDDSVFNENHKVDISKLNSLYNIENIYNELFNFINDFFIQKIPKKIKLNDISNILLPLNLLLSLTINYNTTQKMMDNYLVLIKNYINNTNLSNQKQKDLFSLSINSYNNLFFKTFFKNEYSDIGLTTSNNLRTVTIPHFEKINDDGLICNSIHNMDDCIIFYHELKQISKSFNNDDFYNYFYDFLLHNIKSSQTYTTTNVGKYQSFFFNEQRDIDVYLNNKPDILIDYYSAFLSNKYLFNQNTLNKLLLNKEFTRTYLDNKQSKIVIGNDYSKSFFSNILRKEIKTDEKSFDIKNYFSLQENLKNFGDDFDTLFLNNLFSFSFNENENLFFLGINKSESNGFYLNESISVFIDYFLEKKEKIFFETFFKFIHNNFTNNEYTDDNTSLIIKKENFNYQLFENFLFTHFLIIEKNIGIDSFHSMLDILYNNCYKEYQNDIIYKDSESFNRNLNNIVDFNLFTQKNNIKVYDEIRFQLMLNYGLDSLKNNNLINFNVLNLDEPIEYKDKETKANFLMKRIFKIYTNIYENYFGIYKINKGNIINHLIWNEDIKFENKNDLRKKLNKLDLNSKEMDDFFKKINMKLTPVVSVLELKYTFLSNLILNKENFNDDFVFKNVLVFNIQKLEIDFNHFRKFCIDNLNEHILNKNKIEEKTWNDITCVLNNDVFKSKTTNNKKIKL